MITLYREQADGLYYFQAFYFEGVVLLHRGRLGETGEVEEHAVPSESAAEALLEKRIGMARAEGYAQMDEDQYRVLLLQFAVHGKGNTAEHQRLGEIESLLNDALGWRGLGYCEVSEIEKGTASISASVADARKAAEAALAALREAGQIKGVRLSIETEAGFAPVWLGDEAPKQ